MGITPPSVTLLRQAPGGGTLVRALDFVVNWARANSLWPLTYGTSCCAIEMMATSMPRYDISRFGSEVFRATPRQADLIILAGTIVEKMAEPLVTLYQQLPGPKYVIAMGSCTISGGPFIYDNYSVVPGADRLIPVDVFIPGCPPRPEALLHGLMELQKKIRRESVLNPWDGNEALNKAPIQDDFQQAEAAWLALETQRQAELEERQARFRAEHPDFKPTRSPRAPRTAYPETVRTFRPAPGLEGTRIAARVAEIFPAARWAAARPPAELAQAGADALPEFEVAVDAYIDLMRCLRDDPTLGLNALMDLTAVDWESHYELVALLRAIPTGHGVMVRVRLEKTPGASPQPPATTAPDATAPTLTALFPAANWPEREIFDLFGIAFEGHPDLRRLFLRDDFAGHPLRKAFVYPEGMLRRPY